MREFYHVGSLPRSEMFFAHTRQNVVGWWQEAKLYIKWSIWWAGGCFAGVHRFDQHLLLIFEILFGSLRNNGNTNARNQRHDWMNEEKEARCTCDTLIGAIFWPSLPNDHLKLSNMRLRRQREPAFSFSAFTWKAFAPSKRKYTTWTVALIPIKGLRFFRVRPYTLHLCSSLDCGRWWKVTSKMLTLRQFLVLVQTWGRLITAFNSSRLNDVCHFHFSSSYAFILFWCISRCYFRATFWIKAS